MTIQCGKSVATIHSVPTILRNTTKFRKKRKTLPSPLSDSTNSEKSIGNIKCVTRDRCPYRFKTFFSLFIICCDASSMWIWLRNTLIFPFSRCLVRWSDGINECRNESTERAHTFTQSHNLCSNSKSLAQYRLLVLLLFGINSYADTISAHLVNLVTFILSMLSLKSETERGRNKREKNYINFLLLIE